MPTPDFVIDLRAKIGHHMLWLTAAMGVVVGSGGRVLLARRADTGAWTLPGGIIEPAEHPADAAIREIFEETGVIAVPEALIGVSISAPIRYSNEDRVQYLQFAFRCRAVAGSARVADSESTDVAWYGADALPDVGETTRSHIAHALTGEDRAAYTFSGLERVLGPAVSPEVLRGAGAQTRLP